MRYDAAFVGQHSDGKPYATAFSVISMLIFDMVRALFAQRGH
jgi:hypothetical protein